jgi:hypothetical protein
VTVNGLNPGEAATTTYTPTSVVVTANSTTPVTLQSFEVD